MTVLGNAKTVCANNSMGKTTARRNLFSVLTGGLSEALAGLHVPSRRISRRPTCALRSKVREPWTTYHAAVYSIALHGRFMNHHHHHAVKSEARATLKVLI